MMTPSVRQAKIVCTMGPASREPATLSALARAGMDVVRLNLSHGEHEVHAKTILKVRDVSYRYQKPMAILADLQGPKIRTGPMKEVVTRVRSGQAVTVSTGWFEGDASRFCTTYKRLPKDVRKGDRILISDGLIELRVLRVRDGEVRCEALNGGDLRAHQGMNLPGVRLKIPSLTVKDRRDLAFALEHGCNYIAVSFVRSAADVRGARRLIERLGFERPVIAKLEKPEALENLAAILREADGVMVARGDLGVEMSPEEVPVAQKQIIAAARRHGKPVITATQMLETMTVNPRPTRAEASDVANAIFDGTDAVMLSAETSTGGYPVEAVSMMDRIIRQAEAHSVDSLVGAAKRGTTVVETICDAAVRAVENLDLKLVAVFTESGATARLLSKFRPRAPIVAFSPHQPIRRRMSMFWGVLPKKIGRVRTIDELSAFAETRLLDEKLVKKGDVVGIMAGTPMGKAGSTNMLRIHAIRGVRVKTPMPKSRQRRSSPIG